MYNPAHAYATKAFVSQHFKLHLLPQQSISDQRLEHAPLHITGAKLLHCVPMIHNSTPHRVFGIGELARLIAVQLILISPNSAMNLACACRCLEEPVLRTLWEAQPSLLTLLNVLPGENWDVGCPEGKFVVRCLDLLLEKSNT